MDDGNDAQSPFQGTQLPERPAGPSPGPPGGIADKLRQALQGGSFHPTADANPMGFTRTSAPNPDKLLQLSNPNRAQPDGHSLQAQLQQAAAVLAASQLTQSSSSPQRHRVESHHHSTESALPTEIMTTTIAVSLPSATTDNSQQAERPTLLPHPKPAGGELSGPSLMQQALSQAQAIASSQAQQAAQAAESSPTHSQRELNHRAADHSRGQSRSNEEAPGLRRLRDDSNAAKVDLRGQSQHALQTTPSGPGFVQESIAELRSQQQQHDAEPHLPAEPSPSGYNADEAIQEKFQSLPTDTARWRPRSATPEKTATSSIPNDAVAAQQERPSPLAASSVPPDMHISSAQQAAILNAEQEAGLSQHEAADAAATAGASHRGSSPFREAGIQTPPFGLPHTKQRPKMPASSKSDQLVYNILHGPAGNRTSMTAAAAADSSASHVQEDTVHQEGNMVCVN